MARTIGILAQKGGGAKTTTVVNLAVGLGRLGLRVLAIDADPQGNLSHVLLRGVKPARPTIAEVLLDHEDAEAAIVETHLAGVSIIPADASLADATGVLTGEVGRERRLRLAMAGADEAFDYVVVDTAPTRSIVNVNVLNYVGEAIVPIAPGLFAVLGLAQMREDVAVARRFLENKSLRISGILLTQVERNSVHDQVEAHLREAFGPLVFAAKVPRSIKVEEAHARHEAVVTHAPKSPGAVAYNAFIQEVADAGRAQVGNDPAVQPARPDHAA